MVLIHIYNKIIWVTYFSAWVWFEAHILGIRIHIQTVITHVEVKCFEDFVLKAIKFVELIPFYNRVAPDNSDLYHNEITVNIQFCLRFARCETSREWYLCDTFIVWHILLEDHNYVPSGPSPWYLNQRHFEKE